MVAENERLFADSMHAGNICTVCRLPIKEGEKIVICRACSSFSHEVCWLSEGCRSYHCAGSCGEQSDCSSDRTTSVSISITKDEIRDIKLPPRGRLHTTESLAHEVNAKGRSRSIPAIIAFILGLGAFASSIMFSTNSLLDRPFWTGAFIGTILSGLVSVLIGVVALVAIQLNKNTTGNVPALSGLLAGALSLTLALYTLGTMDNEEEMMAARFEPGKVMDFISKSDDKIRVPLMANVHISVNHRFRGESQGSGIVIRKDRDKLYILSNLHVLTAGKKQNSLEKLKSGPSIIVTLYTGERFTAQPIWMAPDEIDLALLTIDSVEKFDANVKLDLKRIPSIGKRVFAIGNPMGLNWSFTDGVVSGLRMHQFGQYELTVIQIQTPLNPGNSGGGLYDDEGYLVGVNTWIYSKSRSEGLNFSIAIEGLTKILKPELQTLLGLTSLPAEVPDNVH